MNPIYYQTIPQKKKKTDFINVDKYLSPFVLDTQICTELSINNMLDSYNFIVFKPNIGGGGKKVGFVSKVENEYQIQLGNKRNSVKSINELYDYIISVSNRKEFILQKGIELLKYNDAPFDIRVEVQKPYDNWIVTGIVGKVASKKRLVTNRHSGGKGVLLEKILFNIKRDRLSEIKSLFKFIGLRASRLLNEEYDGLREIGIDIGLNQNYEPFIFEINTKPQYGVFRQAGDKNMLNRIADCNKIIFSSIEYIKREL